MPSSSARALAHDVTTTGEITLRGVQHLTMIRETLEHVVRVTGHQFVFAPDSTPDLIDILTVGARSALEGAALGLGVGFLLGLLADRPAEGAALGLGFGAFGGAVRGQGEVRAGWRVRAVRDDEGVPVVTICTVR